MADFAFLSIQNEVCAPVVDGDLEVRKILYFSSLLEWWLIQLGHGTFCGVIRPNFASMGKLTPTTVEFWQRKILTITSNGIQTCSITEKWYPDMLRDFVIPILLQSGCLQDHIFMQDGAPPHIDRRVKRLLIQHFTEARVIRCHFSIACPPRSPDIIPCDIWLKGYFKDNIYRQRPSSLPDLKDNIRLYILNIPADSLLSSIENLVL
ncbi:hypothetical protein HNY73_021835 [Argiope bruennichi]|uniref:Transposase n=1 Tax=Argiope bruennichi TaxID=94029 RepID=A0A8T0E0P2_ARGBR|nr:hypothetical protein HNY73_021835 [Argiope bruennichi]